MQTIKPVDDIIIRLQYLTAALTVGGLPAGSAVINGCEKQCSKAIHQSGAIALGGQVTKVSLKIATKEIHLIFKIKACNISVIRYWDWEK